MRNLHELNKYRNMSATIRNHYGSFGDDKGGAFIVPSQTDRAPLFVIASSGEGWDHVSVSRLNRTPNWPEMEQIKRLFFRDDEAAIQFHVPPSQHINVHPNCLHLWRPLDWTLKLPPSDMVA